MVGATGAMSAAQAMHAAYIDAITISVLLISIVGAGFLGFYVSAKYLISLYRMRKFKKLLSSDETEVSILTFNKDGIPRIVEKTVYSKNTKTKHKVVEILH